ncbi:hypothetical protein [Fundidesulfovibrio agrisoli]|uniref:hypothetical protein n=1 Tax=Fundidesulfovibrio agrisoli TaxID=2922717 RepID=UPI001FAC528A|nr:hypothetical protein [Fundidesulfovibrio agrisoli]
MRLFVCVALSALLLGCSGQPKVVNPNKPGTAAQADYDECRGRAAVATAMPGVKDPETAMQKALDECMKARGYEVTN